MCVFVKQCLSKIIPIKHKKKEIYYHKQCTFSSFLFPLKKNDINRYFCFITDNIHLHLTHTYLLFLSLFVCLSVVFTFSPVPLYILHILSDKFFLMCLLTKRRSNSITHVHINFKSVFALEMSHSFFFFFFLLCLLKISLLIIIKKSQFEINAHKIFLFFFLHSLRKNDFKSIDHH